MSKPDLKQVLHSKIKTDITDLSDIYMGKFSLAENPEFARIILDEYTKHHPDIPNFVAYKKLFRKDEYKESEPKLTDPIFNISYPELTPRQQDIKNVWDFHQAKDLYDERNLQAHKIQHRVWEIDKTCGRDLDGYISFLLNPPKGEIYPQGLPETERSVFTQRHPFIIPESDRDRHTYITAGTGHGKSVTIETLIHHYLTKNTETAVVLLDPTGNLAQSCARLSVNLKNDRLVYIRPSLSDAHTPVFNPFEVETDNWNGIAKATDVFIETFREVMRADGEGGDFTRQMVTLLTPTVSALMKMEGATFVSLIRFLDDDKSEYGRYLDYAKRFLTNLMQLDALKKDFFKQAFNPSKLSIKTKIRNLLNDDYFYNFLVGENTFDLQKEIHRKAFIVFDLSKITKAKKAIGRFIMANVTALAFSRQEDEQVPIHLFVDECQDFISESMGTILTQTRQFHLYATFAQQFCGQGMDKELTEAVIGNSFIKMTGNNGLKSLKVIAGETGVPIKELQKLKRGEFHIKSGDSPSLHVEVPRVPDNQRMSDDEWKEVQADQLKRYYRSIQTRKDMVVKPPPPGSRTPTNNSDTKVPDTNAPEARGAKRPRHVRIPADKEI